MSNYFEKIEEDLRELFKYGKIIIPNDDELGDFYCIGSDKNGFNLTLGVVIVEYTFWVKLRLGEGTTPLFDANMQHNVKLIIRERDDLKNKDSLKILRKENLPAIEFSFKPNFSLKCPELWLLNTKHTLPFNNSLQFDAQALNQLFGTEPSIDFKGQLFYQATNENGFTLKMKLDPDLHKCSFALLYNKYQDPVFEMPFGGVESIEVNLTPGARFLKLQGQLKDGQVKILFDHNFALDELPSWIWLE